MNWITFAILAATSFGFYNFFTKLAADKLSPTIALMFIAGTSFVVAMVATLVFKISDVRDISKKSSSRSNTIKLPGTEINNQFFGGIYDFNSDFTIFNPNVKTNCIFSIDGEEFIRGFMQLKTVEVNEEGDISYNIVINSFFRPWIF